MGASTDQLNDLKAYQQLTSRAKGIGFEVTKVVFRGYGAPQRLQKMHDDALERELQRAAHEQKQAEQLKERQARLEHLVSMKASLDLSSEQLAAYLLASEQGPPAKLVQVIGKDSGCRDSGSHSSIIQIQD